MSSVIIKTIRNADGSAQVNGYNGDKFVYGVSLTGPYSDAIIQEHVRSVKATVEMIVEGKSDGGPQLLVE